MPTLVALAEEPEDEVTAELRQAMLDAGEPEEPGLRNETAEIAPSDSPGAGAVASAGEPAPKDPYQRDSSERGAKNDDDDHHHDHDRDHDHNDDDNDDGGGGAGEVAATVVDVDDGAKGADSAVGEGCGTETERSLDVLAEAVLKPKGEVQLCGEFDLDLSHWHLYGLSVGFGVKGIASYTSTTGCWGFIGSVSLMLRYGFSKLGLGIGATVQGEGSLELSEHPWKDVIEDPDRYSDATLSMQHFFPEGSDPNRCYSPNPMSLVWPWVKERVARLLPEARRKGEEESLEALAKKAAEFEAHYRAFTIAPKGPATKKPLGEAIANSSGPDSVAASLSLSGQALGGGGTRLVDAPSMEEGALAIMQAARLFLRTLPAYASQAFDRLVDNDHEGGTDKLCGGMAAILDASCFRLPKSSGRFWARWPSRSEREHAAFSIVNCGYAKAIGRWQRSGSHNDKFRYQHKDRPLLAIEFSKPRGAWVLRKYGRFVGKKELFEAEPQEEDFPPVSGWVSVRGKGDPPEFSNQDHGLDVFEHLSISKEGEDGRTMNFAKVMRASDLASSPEFWQELAISASNLFVRVVADVQALFATAFARDPHWDGLCASLPVVRKLGPRLEDDALSKHRWVSSSASDWKRVRFAAASALGSEAELAPSAPLLDGLELSPHLWCGLAILDEEEAVGYSAEDRGFSEAPELLVAFERGGCQIVAQEQRPLLLRDNITWSEDMGAFEVFSDRHRPGVLVGHGGAPAPRDALPFARTSSMEHRALALNAADVEGLRVAAAAVELRPECEQVRLSPAFARTFPSFLRLVSETQRKIASKLDAIARCLAGGASPAARQDASRTSASAASPLKDAHPVGGDRRASCSKARGRLDGVRADASELMRLLRRFLLELGAALPRRRAPAEEALPIDESERALLRRAGAPAPALQRMRRDFDSAFGLFPSLNASSELSAWWRARGGGQESMLWGLVGGLSSLGLGGGSKDAASMRILLAGERWHRWASEPAAFLTKAGLNLLDDERWQRLPTLAGGLRPPLKTQDAWEARALLRLENFCSPLPAIVTVSSTQVARRSSWSSVVTSMRCLTGRFSPGATWIVLRRCDTPLPRRRFAGRGKRVELQLDYDSNLVKWAFSRGTVDTFGSFGSFLSGHKAEALSQLLAAGFAANVSRSILDNAAAPMLRSKHSAFVKAFSAHMMAGFATAALTTPFAVQDFSRVFERYLGYLSHERIVGGQIAPPREDDELPTTGDWPFKLEPQVRFVWRTTRSYVVLDEGMAGSASAAAAAGGAAGAGAGGGGVQGRDEDAGEGEGEGEGEDLDEAELQRLGFEGRVLPEEKKSQFLLVAVALVSASSSFFAPFKVDQSFYLSWQLVLDVTRLVDNIHRGLCGTCRANVTDSAAAAAPTCGWTRLVGCAAAPGAPLCADSTVKTFSD